ncbi:GPW/gp25 family protein [Pinibacter soli]|uniref:GPW/gp25 family protein n=1 Tax=Pinibacter soli TaxID=3044211 RepID=A0ABT6RBP9_9BACT|nr:GPW/gp25 family protein [Pinibacter soli]MDI3319998.1 GPW/gp25 family protein [Pinibacter soli]
MATLQQIKSPVWTYSIGGGGAIAEGVAAIRQCIDVIIRTTKGTDPLRPEFGSDVYKYQDQPVDVAIPNIKKAILDAIATWEKRVSITSIDHEVKKENTQFFITYALVDENLSDTLLIDIGNENISTGVSINRLILQGLFPPNPSALQYQIQCSLDNSDLLPSPPAQGFADTYEMYLWVKENWSNYGQWYYTSSSIVGYINPQYSIGSISIKVLSKTKFLGGIPSLPVGYKYNVLINVDSTTYVNAIDLFTADQIKQWANDTLGNVGDWFIETNGGAFSDDFNEDFEIFQQLLVVYTDQAKSVVINITTIPQ